MKQLSVILFLILFLINYGFSQSKGGRWQFENNGADSANWDMFDNSGVLIDTALYAQDAPLQEGTSYLWLDSIYINNFFKIEDSDDLDFTDENIGISAWIYPLISNETQFFISKGVQNSNPKTTNYSLRISNSNKLEFLIRDSANQAKKVASSFTIPLNQWTFVAIYYDFSAHKVSMWNDPLADAVDTLDFDQSFFANNGPLAIGAWYADDEVNPAVAAFKGRIDDVRISGQKEDILPDAVTSLKNFEMNKIASFHLKQNYPNPFNPKTIIRYTVGADRNTPIQVDLSIYNLLGQKAATLVNKKQLAGTYSVEWDGSGFASGIYYYVFKSHKFEDVKKMVLMK